MRPSGVRSNTAPQPSSSRTRSGASLACSSAMRQLLMYCPPRIVSAKCTRQLSRSSLCAIAAAIPPSAMTVWALPSSDLQIRPTDTPPAAAASMAALRPAPPAPMTITSWLVTGRSLAMLILEKSPIRPDPHRAEADVQIRESHRNQAAPGKEHVPLVETGHARISLEPGRAARNLVIKPAHDVAQRVAAH